MTQNKNLKGDIITLSKKFFEIKQIDAYYFLQLVKLYNDKALELEDFTKYHLLTIDLNAEDFDSLDSFFKKYPDECLQQLVNYDEIETHIISRIKYMEDNFGSWKDLKAKNREWERADDSYNLNRGN
jgi:hypothetical protein